MPALTVGPEKMNNRILAEYWIETPHSLEYAAAKLAAAVSAGTFTDVPGESDQLKARFSAEIAGIEPLETASGPSLPYRDDNAAAAGLEYHRAKVRLAVPLAVTGTELTTLLATIAGGIYALRELSGIRILDLGLPGEFMQAHPGPQFGIGGTRALTFVHGRAIVASIIKPNIGLTPAQTAEIVRRLAEAGVDFVKDDEKMTDPPYSPFDERVAAVMKAINDHAERTGKKVMFAFNISHADPETMVRRHDTVLRAGGTCVMVSVNQVGLGGLTYLRKRSQLPIHAHRNGWAALTRCPYLGWEFRAWQKLLRLAGADHLHVNGIRNKYWEDDDSVVNSITACLTPLCSERDRVFPVVGSGMWAGQVPDTYRRTRTLDLIYICGGGILGHPDGPEAGVRSIHQAWEAALADIPLETHARTQPELRRAMEKFDSR